MYIFAFSKPVSQRIKVIRDVSYEEYEADLYNDLVETADFIVSILTKNFEHDDTLSKVTFKRDECLLNALTRSCIFDIIKYKEFHFDRGLVDRETDQAETRYLFGRPWAKKLHKMPISDSKRSAFLMKWIIKYCPINFTIPNDILDDLTPLMIKKLEGVNALFAQHMAFKYLGITENNIPKQQIKDLIYHLRFREVDERYFFNWFATLKLLSDEKRRQRLPKDKGSTGEQATQKTYNIFVASPGDCDELRVSTKKVLEQISCVHPSADLKTNLYMWEHDKTPEFVGSSYQEKVFNEATEKWNGGRCDILILFAWCKFGKNTKKEYDYYLKHIRNELTNTGEAGKKLIFFQYTADCACAGSSASVEQLRDLARLKEWIQSIQDSIAPLGGRRGAINSVQAYERELFRALGTYLNQ